MDPISAQIQSGAIQAQANQAAAQDAAAVAAANSAAWLAANHPEWNQNSPSAAAAAATNAAWRANALPVLPQYAAGGGARYTAAEIADAQAENAKHMAAFHPEEYYGVKISDLAGRPLAETASRYGTGLADIVQGHYTRNPTPEAKAIVSQYESQQNRSIGETGIMSQYEARPTMATRNPYASDSAAGIAWDVGHTGGAVNPFLAQTAISQGVSPYNISLPTSGSRFSYAAPVMGLSSLGQVDWGVHVEAGRDLSSGMLSGSKMVAALPNQTVTTYMPYGEYSQIKMEDTKLLLSQTGELGVYQQPFGHSGYMLTGGGGRAALQSGMFTINAAETPFVANQWEIGSFQRPSGEGLSRLGAEAYGGYVRPLNTTNTDNLLAPNEAFSYFPGNPNNLANLVNPQGANMGKAELPGANIPWTISETSPAIQYMNEHGVIPGSAVVIPSTSVGGRLIGGNTVASVATYGENVPGSLVVSSTPAPWTVSGFLGGLASEARSNVINPITNPGEFIQTGISRALTAGFITAPLAIGWDITASNARGHPEQSPTYAFNQAVSSIFNPPSSEKNLVSPETYQSHLGIYNTNLGSYNEDLGKYNENLTTYNKAAVAYSFGFGPDVTPQYNALQTSQAALSAKQGALNEQQQLLEAERGNVGIPPSIFTKIGNVYEGANKALAPYTTDVSGIGRILAATPDINFAKMGDTSGISAYSDAANLVKGTYSGLTQHPLDIAAAYGGGELYAGAKATIGWGVAKAAMGELPVVGGSAVVQGVGRGLSTPTATVLGGWVEKAMGLIIVGEAGKNIIEQPTYTTKGEAIGRTILQFGGFGAGMSGATTKIIPMEGETPNLMSRGITRVNQFMTTEPENYYAGRGFFSGELEISPLQRYGIGIQKADIIPNVFAEDVGPSASYRGIGIVRRSGSVGQIEEVSTMIGGIRTSPEGTSVFMGSPKPKAGEFIFAKDSYGNAPTFQPKTPLETYMVRRLAPEEAPKIDLGLSIRGRTSSSGLALKEVTPAIKTVVEGHNMPRSQQVSEAIVSTMKEYDVKLYGSAVQKGVGAEIGIETLGSTPKDLDVMVPGRSGKQMSEPFAQDVVASINKAAGQRVAVLENTEGVSTVKVGRQKLFDIHNTEATPEELAAQGVSPFSQSNEYLGLGMKTEKPVVTKEGVEAISYSEQMGRKLSGTIDYSPQPRTVTSKDVQPFSVTGQLAPKFEGRVKDIGHFYMGEMGNIRTQEMSTNPLTRASAEKSRGELEQWLNLWGEDAAASVRAQAAGKPQPFEIDFGGLKPEAVSRGGISPSTLSPAIVNPSPFIMSPATMSPAPSPLPSVAALKSVASLISIGSSGSSVAVSKISTSVSSEASGTASTSASAFSVGSLPASYYMASVFSIPSMSAPSFGPSFGASVFSLPSPSAPATPRSGPSVSPSPFSAPSPFSPPPSPSPGSPSPGSPGSPGYPPPPSPPSWPLSGGWGGGGGGGGGGWKRYKRQMEVFSFDIASPGNLKNPFALSAPKKRSWF